MRSLTRIISEQRFLTDSSKTPSDTRFGLIRKLRSISIFRKGNFRIFILIVLIGIQIEIGFGMSFLLNKDLGIDNIYLSGMFLAAFEMLGYLTSMLLIHRLDRKTVNVLCIVVTFAVSLTLLVMGLSRPDPTSRSRVYKVSECGKRDKCSVC